jgi:hypothetical protein
MRGKKLIAVAVLAVVILGGICFAYSRWFSSNGTPRESLLRLLPPDASAVIYVDLAELRQTPILKNLAGLGTGVTVDPEYKQFVGETGFEYEKDLERVGIGIQNTGAANYYFALADGKFDRKKIEAHLRKNGSSETKNGREIFHLSTSVQGRVVSATFLSNERIAFTDATDLNGEVESGRRDAGHAEWKERFDRLAGSPMFALIRQDAAIGAILNAQAPGGIRSPQLMQLLDQLLWVSIAGKPDGSQFRVVMEGECPNEATMRQLSDFLNGITLMAQGGLNDPKLRQKMDPAERDAYLQLLGSVDVTKLDRGASKSVRLAMVVTPEIWSKVAVSKALAAPSTEPQDSSDVQGKDSPTRNKKAGTNVPAKHQ